MWFLVTDQTGMATPTYLDGTYARLHGNPDIVEEAEFLSPWYWLESPLTSTLSQVYARVAKYQDRIAIQQLHVDRYGEANGDLTVLTRYGELEGLGATVLYNQGPLQTTLDAAINRPAAVAWGVYSQQAYTTQRPVRGWIELIRIALGDELQVCEICDEVHAATAILGVGPEVLEHGNCEWCSEPYGPDDAGVYRADGLVLCSPCTDDLVLCQECRRPMHADDARWNEYDDTYWCENHYRESYCDHCDLQIPHGQIRCDSCTSESQIIKYWDYKPEFTFWPSIPEYGKLYLGAEVETAFRNDPSGSVQEWYQDFIADKYSELIYVKEDSSIEYGYEINTHPMQFEWAMQEFPWDAFQALVDDFGAYETHPSCGGHIHLNKDAFSTPHMYKFLKVHMETGPLLGMLGGRGSETSWGSFSQMRNPEEGRLKIIAKKKYHDGLWQRYVAVNLNPEFSVELRYPQGATSPHLLKKNLQLAHAVYDFSHTISVPQIQKGILKDSGYLLDWIIRREDRYPNLVQFANDKIIQRRDVEAL